MGIGIGPQNWLTQWMHRWNRVEEAPAEMPVLYSQGEVDEIKSELVAEIDRLKLERKQLFTVAEVNKHCEQAAARINKNLDEFKEENSRLKYENERYLDAINEARDGVTEAFVGIPTKK